MTRLERLMKRVKRRRRMRKRKRQVSLRKV
jgi:hypothetical protein